MPNLVSASNLLTGNTWQQAVQAAGSAGFMASLTSHPSPECVARLLSVEQGPLLELVTRVASHGHVLNPCMCAFPFFYIYNHCRDIMNDSCLGMYYSRLAVMFFVLQHLVISLGRPFLNVGFLVCLI